MDAGSTGSMDAGGQKLWKKADPGASVPDAN